MKLNYITIPLIVILVSLTGSYFTSLGMSWYDTLTLPSFTPPGYFIGAVWTVIFILTAISALIFWNKREEFKRKKLIIVFFLINAFLNIFWSFLFFTSHLIGLALIEAVLLEISVISLMILLYPKSKTASALLIPYSAWTLFAIYLNYLIFSLNVSIL